MHAALLSMPRQGLEAVVRQYLPENHHVVLATLGAYVGLFALYKLTRKAPAPVPLEVEAGHGRAALVGAGSASSVPSLLSEGFGKWSAESGNMEKWVKSLDQWEKDIATPAGAAAYEKAIGK